MVGRHVMNYEQIEVLITALNKGMGWNQIQQKLFPRLKVSQLRNTYYKIKESDPDFLLLSNNQEKIVTFKRIKSLVGFQ